MICDRCGGYVSIIDLKCQECELEKDLEKEKGEY